jgi:hypothetical protein
MLFWPLLRLLPLLLLLLLLLFEARPSANVIKLFTAVFYESSCSARVFVYGKLF